MNFIIINITTMSLSHTEHQIDEERDYRNGELQERENEAWDQFRDQWCDLNKTLLIN